MIKPTLTDSVSPSPEVLFQEVGGEAVLLDLSSESYFGLDDVGTRIWRLLQEDGSLRGVYQHLLEAYDVEPERLEADLLQHVADLAAAGLVRIGSDGSVPTEG